MATVWYKTYRWRQLRARVIKEEPTCALQLPGCTTYSESVDHIIPRSERPDLTFVRDNLQGSCKHCNDLRGAMPMSAVEAARNRPPALAFFDVPVANSGKSGSEQVGREPEVESGDESC